MSIENEYLHALVLADKGADVWSLSFKPTDTQFLWRSPNGVRDPSTVRPVTGDGDAAWVDVYEGGWQSVFPNGGNSSTYGGAPLGLHAESATLPWDVSIVNDGPDRAEVRLTVRLARSPIEATRVVSITSGVPTLTIEETIISRGSDPFPMSYGQHITFGPPFLSEHCRIDIPGGIVRGHPAEWSAGNRLAADERRAWPDAALRDGTTCRLDAVPPSIAGFEEQAYVDDVADGWYAITNRELGVGLVVRYPAEVFQHLWYWLVCSGPFTYPWWGRTYSLGLEPFTSATNLGIEACIADGSALYLAPGEPLTSRLQLTAFRSERGVARVEQDGTIVTRA